MLAMFFDKPALEDSRHADMIWSFLNALAPTDPDRLTRKARLISTRFP